MGMGLFTYQSVSCAVISSILFTGPQVFALSKTAEKEEGTYERQQHEFVLSSRNEVAAFCDAGDTLVKGDCEGKAESIVPLQSPRLMDTPGLPGDRDPNQAMLIYLESKEVSENGRAGWSCWSKVVRPDEELRITTALKCKKSPANAVKEKRPGLPGA